MTWTLDEYYSMYEVNEMKQVIEFNRMNIHIIPYCSAPSSDFFLGTLYICNVHIKVVDTSPPVKQCEIRLLVQVHNMR